jgi:hypothetical protein
MYRGYHYHYQVMETFDRAGTIHEIFQDRSAGEFYQH